MKAPSMRSPWPQQHDVSTTTRAASHAGQTSFFARTIEQDELFDSMIDIPHAENDQASYYTGHPTSSRSGTMTPQHQSRSSSVQFDNTVSFFSTSKASVKPRASVYHTPAPIAVTTDCECLKRMLVLLSLPDPTGLSNTIPDLSGIISTNTSIVDLLNRVVTCSCSADTYLLVLVSLVTGRLIESYSVAARTSITFNKDGLCIPGSDLRLSIQQILHELHRIRSTIDVLSARLGRCMAKKESEAYLDHSMIPDEDMPASRSQPLSPVALQQIESDLKTQLRNAARNIVSMLQHL